ncbi:Growth-regulating factor protein [Dioscorea alata]|uniref:Growth-regulating factor protein n=1 Tax=Dioscorea alata TaxID=55571 RepID=A0ACB7UV93_DIOAL|nr:Growth-regulating factor protein [Dioscorea alata]
MVLHTLDTMEDQKDDQEQQRPVPPPPKVARLSSDSSGVVTMAAPSPLMLGLGLGLGPGKPAFTFLQWQELQHQALIYKYMAAGIPVPLHLVVPIWKSVAAASSSSSTSSSSSHHYPSFMMGHGGWFMDYRNSMEPEPGRCRRTDGKKWRCSRDVVPDQKYCERHMHRGRNRSRKPVEQSASASVPTPATALQPSTSNHGTQLSISISSSGFQLNSNNVSPPRLGFSPTSVLHSSKP